MSDLPPLDLRAELARIDRDRAETHKLMREAEKLRAEEHKLWRDWQLAPWAVALSFVAAIVGGIIARHVG